MNFKNNKSGFTIVELLIVIVVIGILAAITIVAYNGIQNRAKTTSGKDLAGQMKTKIEAYNTVESTYPTYAQLTSNDGSNSAENPDVAKLDDSSSVIAATDAATPAIDATTAEGGKKVSMFGCAEGAHIWYWDYTANAVVTDPIKAGAGC